MPAETLAEVLRGDFPEGVAGLDGDHGQFNGSSRNEGCGRARRGG
jgi:hypothetical protein